MLLSLYHTNFGSPFQSTNTQIKGKHQNPSYLPKQLLPCFELALNRSSYISTTTTHKIGKISHLHASLLEAPVLWAGRVCIFYVLLKAGLAGSQANPFISGFFLLLLFIFFCLKIFFTYLLFYGVNINGYLI